MPLVLMPLVLGWGGYGHQYKGLPRQIKSFNFVNKLLQQSDIASLFTTRDVLYNKKRCYKEFRNELISKNKLYYIIININFDNLSMILLIYKPREITTTITVIDYENKNLIKTVTSDDIINNNEKFYKSII